MSHALHTPSPPEFSFEFTNERAAHNLELLKRYEFNLGKALQAQKDSPLSYGKELRHPLVLQQIFGLHPLWKWMKDFLEEGSKGLLKELSKEEQQKDLINTLAFRNHKGASQKLALLKKLIRKDVKYKYTAC